MEKALETIKNHIKDLERMADVFSFYGCFSSAAECKKANKELNEAIAELKEAMKPKTCEWKQCTSEYDTSFEGTCGVKWLLIDGTPTENHMKFCPQCGGKLIEIEPKDNE